MAKAGTTKYASNKQEKRVAKEVDGRTVIASGAIENLKGDVRSDMYLVECKTTEKEQYILNYSTWEKIRREAIRDGMREPLLQVDLLNGKQRLCLLDADVWSDLLDWLPPFDNVVKTNKASYRIHATKNEFPFLLIFEKRFTFTTGGDRKDVRLLVLPWDTFLTYNKIMLKAME